MAQPEPILQENKDRFIIFPVKHHDLWDWYKETEGDFWTAEEIDLQQDITDWNQNLNSDERDFIKHLLGCFAASASILNQKFTTNFFSEVQVPEARSFFSLQLRMESTHFETCSLLLETYLPDNLEKERLVQSIKGFAGMKKKAKWVENCTKSGSFAERLIAFAANSLFFSGAFSSISWLKQRNLLPGLAAANELMARDKNMHSDFAVLLHNNHLINKVPKGRIREIILEVLKLEMKLFSEALPVSLIGIDAKLMSQYLQSATDTLLEKLQCEKEFGVENPFDFNEIGDLQNKASLFEKRVGAYQKAGAKNKDKDSEKISRDADL